MATQGDMQRRRQQIRHTVSFSLWQLSMCSMFSGSCEF